MSLLETLEKIRNSPDPENEKAVEAKILTPILENLGWDTFGSDLYYRYPVGDKKDRGEVDIALMIKKRSVALIEAKASREKLEDYVGQVLRYAFHEGAQICVLTNGQEWWLYLPREEGPPPERKFAAFNIKTDSIEKIVGNLEAYLRKDNLDNREAEKRAKEVLKALRDKEYLQMEIPRIWKTKLDETDEELVNLVTKWVDNEIGLRPAKEQVVALLKGLPIPAVVSSTESHSSVSGLSAVKEEVFSPRIAKPTEIILWGETIPVRGYTDILRSVINGLIKRGETTFDEIDNVGSITRNPNERELRNYYQAGSTGIYFTIKKRSEILIKDAYRLLDHFGFPRSDLEIRSDAQQQVDQNTVRPTGMRLDGEYTKVAHWADIMEVVAKFLYENNPTHFGTVEYSGGRCLISDDSNKLISPRRIGDLSYYVSAWGGQRIPQFAKYLLSYFGHNPDDLELLFD